MALIEDVSKALTDRWQTTGEIASKVERTSKPLSHRLQVLDALQRLCEDAEAETIGTAFGPMWRRVRCFWRRRF